MKKNLMPVLFIGHGSPMNIVLSNVFTKALKGLDEKLPRPRAILVVSAHWLARNTYMSGQAELPQIFDFYGFPEELYKIRYAAKGFPELAGSIVSAVGGGRIRLNSDWGLDHGAWSVLKWIYPQEDIPVIQLSLDVGKSEKEHYKLGRMLRFLREQNVLVIGSGNVVHNLQIVQWKIDSDPFPWALEAEKRIKQLLMLGEHGKLVNYRAHLPDSELAVPTNDHYLPMLYAIALQEEREPLTFIYEGIQNSSISMLSFRIG